MTCKDCVHYGLCKYQSTLMVEDSCLAEQCADFKDRSRFIELPCKVGDPLYTVQQRCTEKGYYNEKKDTSIIDCEFCDCDGLCDKEYYIKETHFNTVLQIVDYYEHYILDSNYEQFRKIFHIKEEAESKLKTLTR